MKKTLLFLLLSTGYTHSDIVRMTPQQEVEISGMSCDAPQEGEVCTYDASLNLTTDGCIIAESDDYWDCEDIGLIPFFELLRDDIPFNKIISEPESNWECVDDGTGVDTCETTSTWCAKYAQFTCVGTTTDYICLFPYSSLVLIFPHTDYEITRISGDKEAKGRTIPSVTE
jgi:hypothetical protein